MVLTRAGVRYDIADMPKLYNSPHANIFEPLPFGGMLLYIRSKTSRHRNSFFPVAVEFVNNPLTHTHFYFFTPFGRFILCLYSLCVFLYRSIFRTYVYVLGLILVFQWDQKLTVKLSFHRVQYITVLVLISRLLRQYCIAVVCLRWQQ